MTDDLDELFAAAPSTSKGGKRADVTREQFFALAAPQLPCGLFTLTLTDGARKVLRVRLERGKWVTGQRTLSIYRKLDPGADPKRDWETLGIVSPTGFNLFKRWRGEWEERWAVAIWALVNKVPIAKYSVEITPTCWMTGRRLKPEDVKCGLCPTWQKRFEVSR